MAEMAFPLWTHPPIAHFRYELKEKRWEMMLPSAPRSGGLLSLYPNLPAVLAPEV